jgi:hypothetical protein
VRRQLRQLSDEADVSPLLGLLDRILGQDPAGTVIDAEGFITAFHRIAQLDDGGAATEFAKQRVLPRLADRVSAQLEEAGQVFYAPHQLTNLA